MPPPRSWYERARPTILLVGGGNGGVKACTERFRGRVVVFFQKK